MGNWTTKGGSNRHRDQHSRIGESSGRRAPQHGYSDKTLALPSNFFDDNYRPQRVAMGMRPNIEVIAFVKGCVGIQDST